MKIVKYIILTKYQPANQVIKAISPYKANDDSNGIFKTSDLIDQMVLSEDIERAFK